MTNVDVRALAKLARLEVTEADVKKLEGELPGILDFVEVIQKASGSTEVPAPSLRNIMRADSDPHESGAFTAELLSAAPSVKDGRVVVKQVISRKQK